MAASSIVTQTQATKAIAGVSTRSRAGMSHDPRSFECIPIYLQKSSKRDSVAVGGELRLVAIGWLK
jgi:hypothetical protein